MLRSYSRSLHVVHWLHALSVLAIFVAGAPLSRGEGAAKAPAADPPVIVGTGAFPGHPEWRYVTLEPLLDRAEVRVVEKKGGAALAAMVPEEAWAAINGGYWLADYTPTGWVRDRLRELKRRPQGAKGGVLAVAGQRVFIGLLPALTFAPELAVQNSPELVVDGGRLARFRRDVRRASRTIACRMRKHGGQDGKGRGKRSNDPGRLILVAIQAPFGDGPTLLETAEFARQADGLGCDSALNLDGGHSTGIWTRASLAAPAMPPAAPIGYGLAIVPRA